MDLEEIADMNFSDAWKSFDGSIYHIFKAFNKRKREVSQSFIAHTLKVDIASYVKKVPNFFQGSLNSILISISKFVNESFI